MRVAPEREDVGFLKAFCTELPSGTPIAGRASGLVRGLKASLFAGKFRGRDASWRLRFSLDCFQASAASLLFAPAGGGNLPKGFAKTFQ